MNLSSLRAIMVVAALSSVAATPAEAPPATGCGNPVTYHWADQAPSRVVQPFSLAGVEVTPQTEFNGERTASPSIARVSDGSLGGTSGYVELFHPGGDEGRRTTFELSFAKPVMHVQVQLLDVDFYDAGFRDVLRVNAWRDDRPLTESITAQVGVGAVATAGTDGTFSGIATASNDDESANVSLDVPGPIDRLAIDHVDGGGPDGRITGVGDITICGAQIGGALSLGARDGSSDSVSASIVVENLGGAPLEAVSVEGDIAALLGEGAAAIEASASDGAVVRVDQDAAMLSVFLDPADMLLPGDRRSIRVELTGVEPVPDGDLQLAVRGRSSYQIGTVTTDLTDDGTEPDLDGDGDPASRFEDDPTPVPVSAAPAPVPRPSLITAGAAATVAGVLVARRRRGVGAHVARPGRRRGVASA